MEKLIGLLNEFCREKRGDYVVTKYREKEHSFDTFVEGKVDYMTDLFVVSKRCEFIKWLIDNNKIDGRELRGKASEISEACLRVYQWREYESLLMILAISDNPIQDLIDLLKDEWFDKAEVVEEF